MSWQTTLIRVDLCGNIIQYNQQLWNSSNLQDPLDLETPGVAETFHSPVPPGCCQAI